MTPLLLSFCIALCGSLSQPTRQEPSPATLFPNKPRTSEQDWPSTPNLQLEWDPRGPTSTLTWKLDEVLWQATDLGRAARVTQRIDDVAFLIWLEQFDGVDATRVTVAAINGFANAGPRYFERYTIQLEGRAPQTIAGRHVILPRGALIRRFTLGPQESVLREWRYVHENKPVPGWAVEEANKDTAARYAFPFRNQSGVPVDLGPYNFFWQNQSLSDSHGGCGIGPFHGGPEDWLQCATGRKNREAEMLLDFQRPIWMLADDFTPLRLAVPYWMGRTPLHEPAEYQYTLDDWCPYAQRLSNYRFADHTHLSRGTSGAAAVAKWDSFAVECLSAVLNDFKTAESLERFSGVDEQGQPIRHPGARQQNPLLWPLWLKIEYYDGPDSYAGDRGLGHKLRLLRWCRPYFPREELEPYEEGMRALVRKLADGYGVTSGGSDPTYPGETGGVLSKPLIPPYSYTFHQQLVTYECQRFGGLSDIGERAARFLGPRPPRFFELRPGGPNDRVLSRNHSADKDQTNKMWAYVGYGNMTHDMLVAHKSPAEFLREMSGYGVNGSSQDLDCTPRHVWEPGL